MNVENQPSQYISDQVQRALRVVNVMAGKEVEGISPKDIAKFAHISSSNVTRALANLEAQFYVERLPLNNNLWRLGKAWVQIANSAALAFSQAQQQLQQEQHNYSRLA